ncbi:MAG: helix-turn-helix transcriptional regulator [Oscillospiraceae bacterium]|nr:helix-turn-helix transcriptional regulator [Oscillospiraceae bacterium]
MDPKQFGQFLSEERKAKRMTQKELADRLGVTDKAISKWERGVCLPDVAKFDDIAAALDLTDIEVLRAHRLPPEPAPEKTPPFVTWRELGTLLLAWLVITTALFAFDLLEMKGVTTYIGLANLTTQLLVGAFAVWLALRQAQGVTRVDWRGVCIYALVCAVLFLLFALLEDYVIFLWLDGADKLFGLEGARFDYSGAWYDRINAYIAPWTPRWVLYWFLSLRILDTGPMFALPLCAVVYPLVKLLKIRRNQKKERDNRKNVCYTEENS